LSKIQQRKEELVFEQASSATRRTAERALTHCIILSLIHKERLSIGKQTFKWTAELVLGFGFWVLSYESLKL
jgi:hypothetical protein